jgi:hypothetical protein
MQLRKILVFTLFVLTFATNLFSQLTVVSPDTVIVTNYTGDFPQDSMYVFYGPGQNGWPLEMKAKGKDVDTLPSTFTWARLDANVDGYWEVLKTETNVDSSEFSTQQSSVYKLHVANSQNDTTYYFVLFADNMRAELFYRPDCDELNIQGIQTTREFDYLNRYIIPPVAEKFINEPIYNWRLEYLDTDLDTWVPDAVQRTFIPVFSPIINPIPREKQYYRVVVNIRDTLGHYVWDTLVYQAISVESNFVASIGGEDNPEDVKGQAPLRVQFKNLSKNAVAYEWSFFRSNESIYSPTDSIWKTLYNFEPPDSLEYINAGKYKVRLKAIGRAFFVAGVDSTCIHISSKSDYITVYNSAIGKLPNVIVLKGDNKFKFMGSGGNTGREGETDAQGIQSIKHLEVYIYSRGGDKVYEYTGDDDDWEGWDGHRMGRGIKVQPGVYFYVVLAQGWDGMQHKARGFVHVYYKD